jgi:uncharacterized membrane protein
MSLKHFHLFFIVAVLAMLAVTAAWAAGFNAAGLETPWALQAAGAGFLLTAPYLAWFWRKSGELR